MIQFDLFDVVVAAGQQESLCRIVSPTKEGRDTGTKRIDPQEQYHKTSLQHITNLSL